ncbi:M12 family metallopeptidase [Actinoplanes sp. NPDC049596]|uniref:M12 family metallopeptidase n=1 Tax=unclassified Actinoplanes TaxID=2626549 RepID=UPI00342EAC4E
MEKLRYCAAPPRTLPVLRADLPAEQQRAIVVGRSMWANGTKLRYAFMESGHDDQKAVVRESFAEWKDIGIGLDFAEVTSPAEAEVRIGFEQGDGSWSYLGRDVLQIGQNDRTMNFGWDLTTPYGRTTARHEIGHTLGMPHEHQNPNAGIVWDEEAVYAFLGGPPNNWPRDVTFHNVLRKLDPREVKGSDWDPDSVMEYSFPGGLVISPDEYKNGIRPPGSISKIDQEQVLLWYPSLQPQLPRLTPFQSTAMSLKPRDQFNAEIVPEASREYSIGTFGAADVVLVLFEEVDGELRYLAGDDDSGEDRNALITVKLFSGRRYVVRVRLYYSWASGESAVMHW